MKLALVGLMWISLLGLSSCKKNDPFKYTGEYSCQLTKSWWSEYGAGGGFESGSYDSEPTVEVEYTDETFYIGTEHPVNFHRDSLNDSLYYSPEYTSYSYWWVKFGENELKHHYGYADGSSGSDWHYVCTK